MPSSSEASYSVRTGRPLPPARMTPPSEALAKEGVVVGLGAVNYLNVRPLVYGLDRHADRVSLRFDVPSACALTARAGEHRSRHGAVNHAPQSSWRLHRPGRLHRIRTVRWRRSRCTRGVRCATSVRSRSTRRRAPRRLDAHSVRATISHRAQYHPARARSGAMLAPPTPRAHRRSGAVRGPTRAWRRRSIWAGSGPR